MVGRIMQSLEDLGIADNTILMFLADNGTDRDLTNKWGDGKKLRGGKGHHDRSGHPRSAHRALARPHQGGIHVR